MGLKQRPEDGTHDGHGAGDQPTPRHGRAALLRLASWFEEADPDRADALATAAYGLHASLHLGGRVDDGVAATTSWWQADPDRSPVTERPGTRPPEPVRDHRAQRARLRDAAESSAHWRRAGAAQVRSLLTEPTGVRASLDLSGAGMEVLMELLTAALGSGDASRRPTSAGDLEFSLRLHVVPEPGAEVTVLGEGGELTLEGLRLCVTPYDQHVVELPPLPEPGTREPSEDRAGGEPSQTRESPVGQGDQDPSEPRENPADRTPSEILVNPVGREAAETWEGEGTQGLQETRADSPAQDPSGPQEAPAAQGEPETPEADTPQKIQETPESPDPREDPVESPDPRDTVAHEEPPGADRASASPHPRQAAQPQTATELLTSLLPQDVAAPRQDHGAPDTATAAPPAPESRPDDGDAPPPRSAPPPASGDPDNETTGPIDLSAHRRDDH
ncbi:DUF2397 family protein [Nocardiopsis sp. FIRDI 009]|uniref:DUF2397 family protein n=1 Tax=Nocardiopsis sp. FIRDI 009 TaxID=714197 RepID=UPI001E322D8A|nr:DUF2397 family protein [Nocardiopsis sp. FIRDI 009]